jgi:hypothetical protein
MRHLSAALWVLVASLALVTGAQAGESGCSLFTGFVDNGDGTVRDVRNGLVWKRCPEGMKYSNGVCVGQPIETGWYSAMEIAKDSRFLGIAGWRLPTIEELASIIRGMDGEHLSTKLPVRTRCHEVPKVSKAINTVNEYTGSWKHEPTFWSSTRQSDNCQYVASFNSFGELNGSCGGIVINVRLVRDSAIIGGEPSLEYLAEGVGEVAERARIVLAEKERIRQEQKNKELLMAREKEKKQLDLFRKSLRQDDETNCGPVIEIRGRLVKIAYPVENYGNEHWVRRDEILPPGYACRFVNGQYQS